MKFAYLIEPPFNFINAAGELRGHDVEIACQICDLLGYRFEPVETEFAQLLPGLSQEAWQMTTGLFTTKERQQIAAFTYPIWGLPDGLLVKKGNHLHLQGYGSIALNDHATLAVIRDQVQHVSAVQLGVPETRLRIFETYTQAATAIRDGEADAYASVNRAHLGFIEQNPHWGLETICVPVDEKPPAFGAFALARKDSALLNDINEILCDFLGTPKHKEIATRYGFSEEEVELVLKNPSYKLTDPFRSRI